MQSNETLNDLVLGIKNNVGVATNEALECQADVKDNPENYNNPEKTVAGKISAGQNQVKIFKDDANIRRTVHNAVKTVKNCMQNVISTTVDNAVTPRVELVVRSITDPSRHGTNSALQDHDRMDSIGNTEKNPLYRNSAGCIQTLKQTES